MKNHSLKILIYVSVIVFVLSCSVFIFLYSEIKQNNQNAELGTIAWQTETVRSSEINTLNSELEQVSDERVLLNSHFIQSSNVVPFLNTVEQLGSSVGSDIQITAVDTGTNKNQLIVSLVAKGSFGQVYKFLTLLENSQYEITFNSMDLHKEVAPSASVKSTDWEGDFQIQLLSFVP